MAFAVNDAQSISLTEEFRKLKVADAELQEHRTWLMQSIEQWLVHQKTYLEDMSMEAHSSALDAAAKGPGCRWQQYPIASTLDPIASKDATHEDVTIELTGDMDQEPLGCDDVHNDTTTEPIVESAKASITRAPLHPLHPCGNATIDDKATPEGDAADLENGSGAKPKLPEGQLSPERASSGSAAEQGEQSDDENAVRESFQDGDVLGAKHKQLAEYMATDVEPVLILNEKGFLGHKRAIAGRIMNHPVSEIVISVLIMANSLVVGQEVEWTVNNPGKETPDAFNYIGYFFNLVFTLEVAGRIFAEGHQFYMGHQKVWNMFDAVLVLSSLMELVLQFVSGGLGGNFASMRVIRLVRIGRILRLIRVARIMRLLIALRLLIVQIISTLKACFWALVLLCLILYVFGMIFAQICSEHLANEAMSPSTGFGSDTAGIKQYWGSVPRAMYTLYKCVTGGVDWENVAFELSKVHFVWVVVFNIFLAFTVFAVLNVVVGVFCQSACESAAHDYENCINVKIREKTKFLHKVRSLFLEIDESGDGNITFSELQSHLEKDHVKAYFEHLNLEPEDAWDLFKIIDDDESSEITMDEFTAGCLRLKGPAKVIDVEKLQYDTRHMNKRMGQFMHQTEQTLQQISKKVTAGGVKTSKPEKSSRQGDKQSKELSRQEVTEQELCSGSFLPGQGGQMRRGVYI